jgi:hypothetical protein
MAMKVNLKPDVERAMEELLPLSGSRSKTAYINEAVREKNERLRRERDLVALREYFSRRSGELRAVNRELRQVARAIDED